MVERVDVELLRYLKYDLVVGATLFIGLFLAIGITRDVSVARFVAAFVHEPVGLALAPRFSVQLLVLGAVFSSLFALNLTFARHLRRVYAPRRRSIGRATM